MATGVRPRGPSGLIIGKFMPPHAGHCHLVTQARAQVERLTLILFSKAAEPIPGDLRLAWLRELFPTVELLHLTGEGPVDFASPAAWDFWIAAIRRAYPVARGPDVLFSSEFYGLELARRLGAAHVAVDPGRSHVPITASQIRARPLAHWRFIPPPVRPYFVRRVVLLGAESTWKTTLAQALARHFDTVWAPEYAREYLQGRSERADLGLGASQAEHPERRAAEVCASQLKDAQHSLEAASFDYVSPSNSETPLRTLSCLNTDTNASDPLTQADMLPIARGQLAAEDCAARQANRVLICDTNLLATLLWWERYWGGRSEEIAKLHEARRYDLALLSATVGTPWVDDGLRDSPHLRDWFQARYAEELAREGTPLVLLEGPFEARLADAVLAVARSLEDAGRQESAMIGDR